MRVVVVGAGLGGLVLAHGLRDHADVVVLDRDAGAHDTGGYRIALTPEAVAVLERHVPASVVRRLRSVSDGPRTFSQFTIADRRLRPIVVAPEPAGQDRMLCQRRALRAVLAEGLGDAVRFGARVVSARADTAGATVTLADGETVRGDLVVAADGARSSALPASAPPTSEDLGLLGIAGSSPLAASRDPLPRYLLRGPALALDRRGTGMFLSLASRGLGAIPDDLADAVGPPSLVWGLIVRREVVGDLAGAGPAALADAAARLVDGWHPWMGARIAESDPERTAAFAYRAASVDGPRFPWPASRITAIGDAVHAMPPTGGRAGSTAIRSAGALADALLATHDLDRSVVDYQARVDEWAVPALRKSLGPVRIIRALCSPFAQLLAGPALSVASSVERQRTVAAPETVVASPITIAP